MNTHTPSEAKAAPASTPALAPLTSALTPAPPGLLQRACACGGTPGVDGECAACRAKRLGLQRQAASTTTPAAVPPIVHEVLRSPGQPLDAGTRAFMEPRFGHDFSRVRVHTDARAAESARAVNALAYTVGRDVVFGGGQYTPRTSVGQRLLAHELTHTIQQLPGQATGIMRESTVQISDPNDLYEREAEQLSAQVVKGVRRDATHVQRHLSVARLQRQADLTRIPPGLPCRPDTARHLSGTLTLLFGEDSFALSASQKASVHTLLGPPIPGIARKIEVHGYANTNGEQSYNWRLSCNRARTIRDELTTPPAPLVGISPSDVSTFMHGETDEFGPGPRGLADNRRVIVMVTSTRVPCPAVTAVPCPTPILIGSRSSPIGCGGGPDFDFSDYPPRSLSPTNDRLMGSFGSRSETTLEGIFRGELLALTPDAPIVGQDMISRFMRGTGGVESHGVSSVLSGLVARSPAFRGALVTVLSSIESQVRAQSLTCAINGGSLRVPAPPISFPLRELTLKALIGGTQGLRVFIKDCILLPGSRTFTATLRFTLCDDFGVDESDLLIHRKVFHPPLVGPIVIEVPDPGLWSFWQLQHERAGHHPFVNEVTVEEPISVHF